MDNLFNISESTSLAFHSLALMAEKAPKRLSVKTLASDLEASEAHLAKVMQRLHKAGFISSVRGPSGGFVISRPVDEISFLNIFEVLESPVALNGCPIGKNRCTMSRCIFDGRMRKINNEILDVLKDIKLSDFSNKT